MAFIIMCAGLTSAVMSVIGLVALGRGGPTLAKLTICATCARCSTCVEKKSDPACGQFVRAAA